MSSDRRKTKRLNSWGILRSCKYCFCYKYLGLDIQKSVYESYCTQKYGQEIEYMNRCTLNTFRLLLYFDIYVDILSRISRQTHENLVSYILVRLIP